MTLRSARSQSSCYPAAARLSTKNPQIEGHVTMTRVHLHLSRSAPDQPQPSEEDKGEEAAGGGGQVYHPLSIVALVVAALRRSLVLCGVGAHRGGGEGGPMSLGPADIGLPTDVRHVAHVTFDPFDGFLGLPVDLVPDVPPAAPSARFHFHRLRFT